MITPFSRGQEAIESFDNNNTPVLNDQMQDYWRRIRKLQTNSATEAYVELKFNTTTGHDHDGTDSKTVVATNLDLTGITDTHVLYNNAGTLAGQALPMKLLSVTSVSSATTSGNITIAAEKQYRVTLTIKTVADATTNLGIIFNSYNTAGQYKYEYNTRSYANPPVIVSRGNASPDRLILPSIDASSQGGYLYADFVIDTHLLASTVTPYPIASVFGKGSLRDNSHILNGFTFSGLLTVQSAVVTSFAIITVQNCDIVVRVYELAQS